MRKLKNPWTGRQEYHCFGCDPNNESGLRMEFYEDGDDIVSFWRPSHQHAGWIDTLHGGISATLLDEACGWVMFRKLQTSGYTAKTELRYLKPISTHEPQLTIRARLLEARHGTARIEGVIEDSQGEACVRAVSTYFTFNQERAQEMGFVSCEAEDEELLL